MENVTEVLYIVPKKIDSITSYPDLAEGISKLLENPVWGAFYREEKKFSGGGWMGWHTCICGEKSACSDIIVKTDKGLYGFNSLVPHYLLKHADEISPEDLQLVRKILSEKKINVEFPTDRFPGPGDIYRATQDFFGEDIEPEVAWADCGVEDATEEEIFAALGPIYHD